MHYISERNGTERTVAEYCTRAPRAVRMESSLHWCTCTLFGLFHATQGHCSLPFLRIIKAQTAPTLQRITRAESGQERSQRFIVTYNSSQYGNFSKLFSNVSGVALRWQGISDSIRGAELLYTVSALPGDLCMCSVHSVHSKCTYRCTAQIQSTIKVPWQGYIGTIMSKLSFQTEADCEQ